MSGVGEVSFCRGPVVSVDLLEVPMRIAITKVNLDSWHPGSPKRASLQGKQSACADSRPDCIEMFIVSTCEV